MIASALHSAWRRQQAAEAEQPREPAPVTWFSPRQLPASEFNIARELNDALGDAVEKVMPSVVVIRTEKTQYVLKVVQKDLFGFLHEYRRVPEQLAGESFEGWQEVAAGLESWPAWSRNETGRSAA